MQTNAKGIFYQITFVAFSPFFNKPTSRGNILTSIHIDREMCEKMSVEVYDFLYKCDLESRSGSSKLESKC